MACGCVDDKTGVQNLVVIDKKPRTSWAAGCPKQNIASVDSKQRDSGVRPLQQLLLLEKFPLEWKCRGKFLQTYHWIIDTSWYLLLSNMISHELSSSLAALFIYTHIYGTRMYMLFFQLATQWLWFDGRQSCQPQQTWSVWPCLHHQQTMASTKLWPTVMLPNGQLGCVTMGKPQVFDGVCQGVWNKFGSGDRAILQRLRLKISPVRIFASGFKHHPFIARVPQVLPCAKDFLWNWYESWSQCHVRQEFQALTSIRFPARYFLRCFFFCTSCNKNSWIPLLLSYGLVQLPTSKSSVFPEKPTTFSRAGWFPTVITCHIKARDAQKEDPHHSQQNSAKDMPPPQGLERSGCSWYKP